MLSRGQYAQAEAALHDRLRRSPHDGESRMLLARTLGAQDDLRGCALQLHMVPFWWPTKAEAVFREGQAHLMADRAKDAEACWLAAIKDDPLHPSPADILQMASQQLLELYATENRWDDAAQILWQTYERASPADRLSILGMRVRSELERLAPVATIRQLERYVAADPTDWQAFRALAQAERALGRREDASRDFQAGLAGCPDDPRFWRDYLGMLYDLGNQNAWKSLLARVPPCAESEPEIWRFRGLLKEQTGDWAGAAEDYRMALTRHPYVMASHYRLAMVEERLGHRDLAVAHRKQADRLREARSELRVAFSELITAEEARENQKASNPDLTTSMRRLASVCESLGWARLAEAWYKLADAG
jgi:tetratricopeptide (TPR) repeat protein